MTASSEYELVYAEPGDDDLACDIIGITVTSVLSFDDNELMITLSGGSGLLNVDGKPTQWENGEVMELVCGFFDHPQNAHVIALMVDVLTQWQNDGTKLRLLSAQGKMTKLVEDDENFLPIPCGTVEMFS
jgi:hypothetical protein